MNTSTKFVFIATLLLATTAAHAGPKRSILKSFEGERSTYLGDVSKLTPSGSREFQKMYEIVNAAQSGRSGKELVIGWGNTEYSLLEPRTNAQGHSTGVVQQMSVGKDGTLTRAAFEIPPTFAKPLETKIEEARWGFGGKLAPEIVVVQRSFDLPSSPNGKIDLKQTFLIREVNGKPYRILAESETVSNNQSVRASLDGGNMYEAREVHVAMNIYDPNSKTGSSYYAAGQFNLPDSIPGEVVSLHINGTGSRLQFITSEGVEYTYAIERKPDSNRSTYMSQDDYRLDHFDFRQVGMRKLPKDDFGRLFAEVKVYPGRKSASEAVSGIDLSEHAAAPPAAVQ